MPNEKFRDRYRIPSARLAGWDYAKPGWYFVTICTHKRNHYFGEVVDAANKGAEMALSPIGQIALQEIVLLRDRRPHVLIDTFVIMPNHVHFLLKLRTPENLQPAAGHTLRANSLGAIIGQWKAGVTRSISIAGHADFAWQDRYHDKVIRYAVGLEEIRVYIRNNPHQWYRDRNNKPGVYM
ncbi:MAG: transposase [Patescibacteria group bacterium]